MRGEDSKSRCARVSNMVVVETAVKNLRCLSAERGWWFDGPERDGPEFLQSLMVSRF